MLSKRNAGYGRDREVRPDTFVVEGDPGDKVHPHFYCDGHTLMALHQAFEVLDLRDREQAPGAYHREFTNGVPPMTQVDNIKVTDRFGAPRLP